LAGIKRKLVFEKTKATRRPHEQNKKPFGLHAAFNVGTAQPGGETWGEVITGDTQGRQRYLHCDWVSNRSRYDEKGIPKEGRTW
jgi:hypothetical protein